MSCCSGNKTCEPPKTKSTIHDFVSTFYAEKQEQGVKEMGSNLCAVNCPLATRMTKTVEAALEKIHADVKNSYFGCGLPYPYEVEGMHILDLGSGTGRDVFLLGGLAGANGHVTGVDMTLAMIERSTSMIPFHTEAFGFNNFEFRLGTLEELDKVEGIQKDSFDIIISNCVINLCADKGVVLKHAFDILKVGGELCFSDVYTENPLPDKVKNNERIWNECFGGALPWAEFLDICASIGFVGPFVVSSEDYKPVTDVLTNELAGLKFWSKTVRLFKPNPVSKASDSQCCSGQHKVTYLGTVTDAYEELYFTQDYVFKVGEATQVTTDIAHCLKESRFAKHFKFEN